MNINRLKDESETQIVIVLNETQSIIHVHKHEMRRMIGIKYVTFTQCYFVDDSSQFSAVRIAIRPEAEGTPYPTCAGKLFLVLAFLPRSFWFLQRIVLL